MKKCLILLSLLLALCLTFSTALAVNVHPTNEDGTLAHEFHDEDDQWETSYDSVDYPSQTNSVGHILFKCEYADYEGSDANEFKERIVQPLAPEYPTVEDVLTLDKTNVKWKYTVNDGCEDKIVGKITQPTCTTAGSVTVKIKTAGYPNGTIVKDGNTYKGWKGDYPKDAMTKTYTLPAFGHQWSGESENPQFIVITPATCTQEGELQDFCLVCGEKGEVTTVEAIDHVYEDKVEDTATCVAAGLHKTWKECKYCHDIQNYEEEPIGIDKNGHDWGIWVKNEELSYDAKCEEEGLLVEERYCKLCLTAKQIQDTVVEKLGHDMSDWIVEPATCASPAKAHKECQREGCDYQGKTYNVPGSKPDPTNHPAEYRLLVEDKSKAPNCVADGYNAYMCTLCKDPNYLYFETVPALGHIKGDKVGEVEGSCKGEGTAPADIYECTRENCDSKDHAMKGQKEVPVFFVVTGVAPEHKWTDWEERTPFQADEEGNVLTPAYWLRECTVCGDTEEKLRNDAVDMNVVCEVEGHDFDEWEVTTEPTCTEAGEKTRVCKVCEFTETEEIEALGHDYVAGEPVAPTCEEDGYCVYTCSVCGDSYEDDFVDALGHDYVATVYAPTCLTDGYTNYTCTFCGDTFDDDVVEALGHDFEEAEVVAPTCLTFGYTVYTCTRCEISYASDFVDALDHDWDDGVITKEPTVEEDGTIVFTCQRCGETEEYDVPFIPEEEPVYTVAITSATDSHVTVAIDHDPNTMESEVLFARVTLITTGNTFMTMNYPVTGDTVEIDLGGALYAITVELIGSDTIVPGEYTTFDSDYYFF